MELESGFFNSSGGDHLYDAEDFTRYLQGIVSDGVIDLPGYPDGEALKVVATGSQISNGPPAVRISEGKAFLNGFWGLNLFFDEMYLCDLPQPIAPTTFMVYLCLDKNMDSKRATVESVVGNALPPVESGKYYLPLATVDYSPGMQPTNNDIHDLRAYAGVKATSVGTSSLQEKAVTNSKVDDNAIGLLQLAKTGLFVASFDANTIVTSPFIAIKDAWRNFAVGTVILAAYTPPVDVNLFISGGMTCGHYPTDSAACNFVLGVDVNAAKATLGACRLGVVTGDKDPFAIPFSRVIQLTAGVAYTITAQMKVDVAKQQFDYAYLNGTIFALPR